MSQLQVTGEAKIRAIQGPVVANSGIITALDGEASQYVRGDGTLADFPTSSGGGSSVSYYLNSSVSQGTIGGVAYRELSKEPIIGAGTDIAISANGYVASYLTDANDPDVILIPGGNFNCEFYFSVNNNTGNPFFYAELYKYDGTTFTLLGSSVGVPEYINQGTVINPYYFAIPVATATLALTDRLAIRIYVNVDGRTITLHTENGHLCQVVTTLSKGMVSLNNLTDQSQFITTGTSGTDFNIVSSGDTHTFNIPSASASNRGLITTGNQTIAGNKVFLAGVNVDNLQVVNATILNHQTGLTPTLVGTTAIGGSANGLFFNVNDNGRIQEFIFDSTGDRDYTFPDLSGTLALLEGAQTFTGLKTFGDSIQAGYGISLYNGIGTGALVSATYTGFYAAKSGTYTNITFAHDGDPFFSRLKLLNNATYDYTFPAASGTVALTSDLSGYVPYTGATTDVSLGNNTLLSMFVFIEGNGTSGGILSFKQYGTSVQSTTNHTNIFATDTDKLSFNFHEVGGGRQFTFNVSSITAGTTRTYTMPNASGTLALTSQLPTYGNIASSDTNSLIVTGGTGAIIGAGVTLTLLNATATNGGIVSGVAQTFGGAKTFVNSVTAASFSAIGASSGFNIYRRDNNAYAGGWYSPSGSILLDVQGVGTAFTIASSTGAATFSSNIGLGVTPSLWDASWLGTNTKNIEIGASGTFISGGDSAIAIGNNFTYSSFTFKYARNFPATYYIQNTALGEHQWFIAPSGTAGNAISFTQAMTLTNTGNVGIGTSSPITKLHILGNGHPFMIASDSATALYTTYRYNSTIDVGYIGNGVGAITGGAASDFGIAAATGNLLFATNGVGEKMRITSGGKVLIGTTDGGTDFSRIATTTTGQNIFGLVSTDNSSGPAFIAFRKADTSAIGSITRIGTTDAVAFNTTSDYRLKEDLKEIKGLEKVSAIKVYDFKWKNNQDRMDGVIAHELAEVLPYAVHGEKDAEEMQSVDYSKLVPIMVKAIQELKLEIEQLKNK
jgi:hypothetical protein